jgi:hypothetical protein
VAAQSSIFAAFAGLINIELTSAGFATQDLPIERDLAPTPSKVGSRDVAAKVKLENPKLQILNPKQIPIIQISNPERFEFVI